MHFFFEISYKALIVFGGFLFPFILHLSFLNTFLFAQFFKRKTVTDLLHNFLNLLQVLGLERLKSELQERGLKCGGTLQERASRLFLLKTTPLEKLPKKLLAKK